MKKQMRLWVALVLSIFFFSAGSLSSEDLARTPPMGWNSWNNFGCDVSENLIRETADAMVATA